MSHLLQMRGLKRLDREHHRHEPKSHLLQMRGLKLINNGSINSSNGSHLLQMRGLKHYFEWSCCCFSGVASFTDAWIETIIARVAKALALSHLLQMRGLKRISASLV